MITLLRREFTVELLLEKAWQHFARVEQWPSWAKHIKQIEAKGFGKSVIGRLFAKVYSKSLDRAIPLLVEEMNASRV